MVITTQKRIGGLLFVLSVWAFINRLGELSWSLSADFELIVFSIYVDLFLVSVFLESPIIKGLQVVFILFEACRILAMGEIEDFYFAMTAWNLGFMLILSYTYKQYFTKWYFALFAIATYFAIVLFFRGRIKDFLYRGLQDTAVILAVYGIVALLLKEHLKKRVNKIAEFSRRALVTAEKSVKLNKDMYSDLMTRDHGG